MLKNGEKIRYFPAKNEKSCITKGDWFDVFFKGYMGMFSQQNERTESRGANSLSENIDGLGLDSYFCNGKIGQKTETISNMCKMSASGRRKIYYVGFQKNKPKASLNSLGELQIFMSFCRTPCNFQIVLAFQKLWKNCQFVLKIRSFALL